MAQAPGHLCALGWQLDGSERIQLWHGRATEVIGIPLPQRGYHVVEVESRILGNVLLANTAPMHARTGALVTNLAVHFKLGRSSSQVWVTTLDRGRPVTGARVAVSHCNGKPLWTGSTDASGIEPWRFNISSARGPANDRRAHAVFDRTLLRVGETVAVTGRITLQLGGAAGAARRLDWAATPAGDVLTLPLNAACRLSARHEGASRPWLTVQALAAVPLKAPLFAGYRITKTVSAVERKQPGAWSRAAPGAGVQRRPPLLQPQRCGLAGPGRQRLGQRVEPAHARRVDLDDAAGGIAGRCNSG